jgi:CRISP-associated protein Cas1
MTTNRPKTDPPASESLVTPRAKHLPLVGVPRGQPPAVVPARMLNEVMYCERLMYLEWVQGEFADNYFTVDGRLVHDRADTAGGQLPFPRSRGEVEDDEAQDAAAANPYQARSVWLTSESLGLTAKIDIIESDANGQVTPVEYKRGSAPDLREGAYLPERVQLCAHVLLLRDHGYTCNAAEIFFAKSKRRVRIDITETLIQQTQWALRVAREVATFPEPPPPLVDSPKCRGCSLAGICLPDEINLLRRLDQLPIVEPPADDADLVGPLVPDPWGLVSPDPEPPSPIRRLYASLDERVPLYVHDPRAQIGLAGERLSVRGEDGTVHVRLMNTSQVVLRGNVQLTTQAARALLDRGIPVTYLSGGGWYSGRLAGNDTNNIDLRIAQFRVAQDEAASLALARSFVVAKLRNSRTLLRRNHPELDPVVLGQLKQLTRKAAVAVSADSLLGIEGAGAREYFRSFAGTLRSGALGGFDFERRNRRPPRDPTNALLSFTYALLTKELVITVGGVGLEPLLGFYHKPRFGRPALALDLMEEFRPLVADSVVMTVINTGVVRVQDFTILGDECSIKAPARNRIIEAYERRMDQTVVHPLFGYSASYRRIFELQARLLSRVLTGELPRYEAFTTR